jgi:cupin domain
MKKELNMRRKLSWLMLFSATIVLTGIYVAKARATTASGFVGTTVAVARFGEIDVFNQLPRNGNVWLSLQKTKGSSDVYVQSNVWQPKNIAQPNGGSTGWHTHPGHSLIIVTAGTVTAYEGNDPTCTPTVYTQGMGFVDPGGDHVHLLRNEGSVVASTITIQLIPAGATRRIDAPDPGNCHF